MMKIFECQNCLHPLFFENTYCERCNHSIGYLSEQNELKVLLPDQNHWKTMADDGRLYRYCENFQHGVCNWLILLDSGHSLCEACRLNRTIPNLASFKNQDGWQKLEQAKHRLIYSLNRLNLPVLSKADTAESGLFFDFLSDEHPDYAIKTGYAQGLITINLAEADSVHREYIRRKMSEPYRTLIGHFRHEVGHFYWDQLVLSNQAVHQNFRRLFGDENLDYNQALQNYYQQGPPANWQESFISEYATTHPWEDWAETWAHYLHLVDMLESAYSFGLSVRPNLQKASSMSMYANFDPYIEPDFRRILDACIPLTFAVNSLNRGMGQPDLYPFIIPPPVVKKLRFVHQLLQSSEN